MGDRDIVVSVLDITNRFQQVRFADIHDEHEFTRFLSEVGRGDSKVRLYIAEQSGHIASGLIKTFEEVLGLDPRFFQSSRRKQMVAVATAMDWAVIKLGE